MAELKSQVHVVDDQHREITKEELIDVIKSFKGKIVGYDISSDFEDILVGGMRKIKPGPFRYLNITFFNSGKEEDE